MHHRASEFTLLKFVANAANVRPTVLDDRPRLCSAVLENRARENASSLTQPDWDLIVEVCHDAIDQWDLAASFIIEGGAIERSMDFFATQNVVIGGPRRGLKSLSFLRRKTGMTHADFIRHYAEVHGPMVAKAKAFQRHVNRYVQHHVMAASATSPANALQAYDAISEFWVDSAEDALAAWNSPEYLNQVQPDRSRFIEHSFRLIVDETIVYKRR